MKYFRRLVSLSVIAYLMTSCGTPDPIGVYSGEIKDWAYEVFTGQIVSGVEEGKIVLTFRQTPDGSLVTMFFDHPAVEFDGEMKLFHNNKIDYLDLAYAITVHKSQGSEYPNVVMPIVDDHRIMLTRKLIYTAITRGKQNVCLIGSKRVLREALKKVFLNLRYSNLNQKIENANINLFHQN